MLTVTECSKLNFLQYIVYCTILFWHYKVYGHFHLCPAFIRVSLSSSVFQIRLSVGLEDTQDLLDDLTQALQVTDNLSPCILYTLISLIVLLSLLQLSQSD